AHAPASPGADAHPGQEPVAAHCLEPGGAEEIQAVDPGGAEAAAATGAGALDAAAAGHAAGDAGGVGAEGPASGASGRTGNGSPAGSATASLASGSGSGDCFGHGADHGGGEAVPGLALLGQLSGLESVGEKQRREKASGSHQQTRQSVSTLSPGARRGQRRAGRQELGPNVCPTEGQEAPRRG